MWQFHYAMINWWWQFHYAMINWWWQFHYEYRRHFLFVWLIWIHTLICIFFSENLVGSRYWCSSFLGWSCLGDSDTSPIQEIQIPKLCSISEWDFALFCQDVTELIDGRWMPSDGKSSHGIWPGDLIIIIKITFTNKIGDSKIKIGQWIKKNLL
jgi:hypothetical protein